MRKFGLIGLALSVPAGLVAVGSAQAADDSTKTASLETLMHTPAYARGKLPAAPVNCKAKDAPYKDYSCLDAYLGDGFFERLINYYRLEIGHEGPPADPKAPPGRRAAWGDASPQSVPPYPFTEWPYGGTELIGVNRVAAVDSPFMTAIANTALGKAMGEAGIQMYGWINGGGNISSNTLKPSGNAPAAYDVNPNTVQLDQAVIYIERTPDTVQTDHVDWGFRFSAIYGENERYTYGYGYLTYQLNGHNLFNGVDFPMVYGELFIPQFGGQGTIVRLGRYISLPDIEAQLAPNNYMYTHSLTYSWDNYTNTGLQFTTALSRNWWLQYGLSVGTEAAPWHMGQIMPNPSPNQVFPGNTMLVDPGAKPSLTIGARWESDNAYDNVYVVMDAANDGTWGYNNLQWTGITWYHKFNEQWHFAWETYALGQYGVLNGSGNNAAANAIIADGGFPFAPLKFNQPGFAFCNPNQVTCTARAVASVAYINWHFAPLDNFSVRLEYYNDMQGQRTGIKTPYVETGLGWQHWLSPQIEFRPEVTYYNSLEAPAFNGNPFNGTPPTRHYAIVGAADIIWHF
jgi:hypothetical protein